MSATAAQATLGANTSEGGASKRRLPLLPVAALLQEQQTLTAVERFAQAHASDDQPLQARYYRDLIPLERPRSGQQYAFEVDLDLCTGCKACVAACHTLNGLDEHEMWRSVGLLHGGTPLAPALQTVTTACHHCVEPACLKGCPVQAYEKDPITGIVKHLDDQCFGCQYCTLMCPYDAPKYSKARGIVRKCDMCSDRLEHAEAPGCVQACPNEAIAIRIVEQAAVVQASDANGFLPGAPTPEHTLPTTVYKTQRPMPSNMLPVDFYTTSPEHSHPPLVVMLTLTQLSAGAFAVSLLVQRLSGSPAGSPLAQAVFGCGAALVALGASVFHLGRPQLFYRAFLGLRTSWLSREAIAFGVFAKLAMAYAAFAAAPLLPAFPFKTVLAGAAPELQTAAAATGMLGVFFSVMVYVATRRPQWSGTQTGVKFFGTTLLLGAAAVLAVKSFTSPGVAPDVANQALLWVVLGATGVKLAYEASGFLHYNDKQQTIGKRMSRVMWHDLRVVTLLRFGAALAGLAIAATWLTGQVPVSAFRPAAVFLLAVLLVGESAERYLFFRAAPASRMPGGLR